MVTLQIYTIFSSFTTQSQFFCTLHTYSHTKPQYIGCEKFPYRELMPYTSGVGCCDCSLLFDVLMFFNIGRAKFYTSTILHFASVINVTEKNKLLK